MFVIVSQRPEFVGRWQEILTSRGAATRCDDLAKLTSSIARHPVSRLAVVDFNLLDGLPAERLRELCRQCGGTRLLLGGSDFPPPRELAALAAGVAACCDVALLRADLERIVDTVLQGGVWISRLTIPLLVSKLQAASVRTESEADAEAVAPDPLGGLTLRQREVAELVGKGASNKQIARALDITDRTVKAHLTTIFDKLGVTDRLQLALYVTKQGQSVNRAS